MPDLTAIKEHRYGGKQRFPGDDYTATEKDAKLLKAVGRAKDRAESPKSPVDLPAEVMSRNLEPVEEPNADPEPARGEYLRRDLTAEKPTRTAPGRTGRGRRSRS